MALPILHDPSNQLFFSFFNIYKQANFIQKKAIGKIGIEHKRAADLMSECTPTRAFSMFHPLFAMLSQSSDLHVPPAGSFSPSGRAHSLHLHKALPDSQCWAPLPGTCLSKTLVFARKSGSVLSMPCAQRANII